MTDAKGIVEVIMLLPGQQAARVRRQAAELLCRYLGGDLALVDEFVWEQHVQNYLMAPFWGGSMDEAQSIADSYATFLALRRRGVRAHSWV